MADDRQHDDDEEAPVPGIRAGVEDRNLAGNVRELRRQRGWSQGELARRMAVLGWPWAQQTTRRVEEGSRKVSAGEAAALARVLGTTADRLLMPGQQASLAWLLSSFTARARRAHAEIARAAAVLEAAQRQVATSLAEAERSPWKDDPALAGLLADAREALALDAAAAVGEGPDPDEECEP